jgi:hypothetical protein
MSLVGTVFEMSAGATQFPQTLKRLQLYTATTYVGTPELTTLFNSPATAPVVALPGGQPTGTSIDGAVTPFNEKLFEEKVKGYFRKLEELKGNLHSLFLVILGQCDPILCLHIQGQQAYVASKSEGNCLWLLRQIRALTTKFDSQTYVHDANHTSLCRFYDLHQGKMLTSEYYGTNLSRHCRRTRS